MTALKSGEFRWVEASGHTPHLEQPAVTASALVAFVRDEPIPGDADIASSLTAVKQFDAAVEAMSKAADAAKEKAADLAQRALSKPS